MAAIFQGGPALGAEAPPGEGVGDRARQYREAVSLVRQGKGAEARSILTGLVATQPDYLEARIALGRLHLNAKELAEAEAQFRAVLDRAPGSPRALLGLAEVLGVTGHLDEAIALATRAVASHPRPAFAHRMLGGLYEARGEQEKALTEYKAALRLLLRSGR